MSADTYRLDAQVGFLLRKANQRHLAIFAERIPELTPPQFAACAKLAELGPVSQVELGRHTAMDAATMKGVIDRLAAKGLVTSVRDPEDGRRRIVRMTDAGRAFYAEAAVEAARITEDTLAPLGAEERRTLLALLERMSQQ